MEDSRVVDIVDITKYFYEGLKAVQPNTVLNVFLWLLGLIFLFGLIIILIRYKWQKEKLQRIGEMLPSHLSTIGVLGTFVGISVGLATFNVHDLDSSIPRLLDGLKLAFSTSIFGLTSATALRATNTLVVMFLGEPAGSSVGGGTFGSAGIFVEDQASLLALRLVEQGLEKGFKGTSEDIIELKNKLDELDKKIQDYANTKK